MLPVNSLWSSLECCLDLKKLLNILLKLLILRIITPNFVKTFQFQKAIWVRSNDLPLTRMLLYQKEPMSLNYYKLCLVTKICLLFRRNINQRHDYKFFLRDQADRSAVHTDHEL